MLSQPSGQVSLGTNPFLSAPMEVPDIPPRGSTGGRGADSLLRGRIASPSGVVPPSPEEDVMPPVNVSVSPIVASVGLGSLSGSLFPLLGDSASFSGSLGQLCDRGDSGLTQHVVSADVHGVPHSMSTFDPSSLLFPFSDSGFSSLLACPPLSLPSFPLPPPPFTLCLFLRFLLPLLLLLFLFSRFRLLFLLFFLLPQSLRLLFLPLLFLSFLLLCLRWLSLLLLLLGLRLLHPPDPDTLTWLGGLRVAAVSC